MSKVTADFSSFHIQLQENSLDFPFSSHIPCNAMNILKRQQHLWMATQLRAAGDCLVFRNGEEQFLSRSDVKIQVWETSSNFHEVLTVNK